MTDTEEKIMLSAERYDRIMEQFAGFEGADEARKRLKAVLGRRRAKKAPGSPKGIRNAYIWFCQEKRPGVLEAGIHGPDIFRELGRLWGEEEDKTPWNEKAATDRERYEKECITSEEAPTTPKKKKTVRRVPGAPARKKRVPA